MTAPKTAPAGGWRDYAIDGALLGAFMVSACLTTALLEHPRSPLFGVIRSSGFRLLLTGLAMGLTAIGLFLSPWGKRTGAHMNPAVTLAFHQMGRISSRHALGYIAGQFVGGTLGILLCLALVGGDIVRHPTVNFVVTVPGMAGLATAWMAEFGLSFLMLFTVLTVSAHERLAPYTAFAAGVLLTLFIAFEAPISGMSINPARTFASAAPSGIWTEWWIYFSAPPLGMLAAAGAHGWRRGLHRRACCHGGLCASRRCLYTCYLRATTCVPDDRESKKS